MFYFSRHPKHYTFSFLPEVREFIKTRASRCRRQRTLLVAALRGRRTRESPPAPWRARFSLAPFFSAPRPQSFQTPPPPKRSMSIRCLQKPWGSSKTLGSLRNLGGPPKPWDLSTRARGRRKPGGAGARVASPWSQGTPPARWAVGAAPAAGTRRVRAPRAATRAKMYIHTLTSGKDTLPCVSSLCLPY